MNHALLIIDMQNDFMPGGALPVADAYNLVPVINKLIAHFPNVIASQDWHPPDHQSFASVHRGKSIQDVIVLDGREQVLWPEHCVQHTKGAELISELDCHKINHLIRKGSDAAIDSYSAFFDNGHQKATELHELLQKLKVSELFLCGVATNFCVLATALDAVKLGYKTRVIERACKGIEDKNNNIDEAFSKMSTAGVKILNQL